jgi:hypothetical protein
MPTPGTPTVKVVAFALVKAGATGVFAGATLTVPEARLDPTEFLAFTEQL